MSDVIFDLSQKRMTVHQRKAEAWKVTLVYTGAETRTGVLLKRVRRYLGDEAFCLMGGDGVKIVMTTHDLGQARRHADRIVFLHQGRLIEHADAARFFARPGTPEARAFVAGELLA